MSAFLVSDKHVNTIVTWANANIKGIVHIPTSKAWDAKKPDSYGFIQFDFSDVVDCQAVAQMLIDENYRSLNARYKDEYGAPHAIKFQFQKAIVPAVGIAKACECLDYQSCETEDWEKTIACKLLNRIKATASKIVLKKCGYDEAPWGID